MPKLKREIGLFEVTMYGIGVILGAGIYVLLGKAAGVAGNSVWISFVISAVIALFTGLSYAELSSMFPKSAAEYIYTKKAFGNRTFSFLIGWISIFAMVVAGAAVALGFAGYASVIFGVPIVAAAIGLIILTSLINFWGMKESATLNIIFTSIEMFGLLMVIFFAFPHLGEVNLLEMPAGWAGVFTAATLIFFAYLGFEDLVNISEETKNPRKNIPLGLLISVVVTSIIYILVSMSAVTLMDWQALGASKAPLADTLSTVAPWASGLLSYIALFATGGTVLFLLVAASRKLYGMAEEHEFSKKLCLLHPKTKTPWVAIGVTALAAIGFATLGDIKVVAELTDFAAFTLFAAVNLSVIVLRFMQPKYPRKFFIPLSIGKMPVIPLLGLLFCFYLLTFFTGSIYTGAAIVFAVGLVVFWLSCRIKF